MSGLIVGVSSSREIALQELMTVPRMFRRSLDLISTSLYIFAVVVETPSNMEDTLAVLILISSRYCLGQLVSVNFIIPELIGAEVLGLGRAPSQIGLPLLLELALLQNCLELVLFGLFLLAQARLVFRR